MQCRRIGNAIVCFNRFRKFKFKNKIYRLEDWGMGYGIRDSQDKELFPDEQSGRLKSKFYREYL